MAKNFLNPMKETDNKVQEAQRVPNKMNPRKPTARHIIIKVEKFKNKGIILKGTRGK